MSERYTRWMDFKNQMALAWAFRNSPRFLISSAWEVYSNRFLIFWRLKGYSND